MNEIQSSVRGSLAFGCRVDIVEGLEEGLGKWVQLG